MLSFDTAAPRRKVAMASREYSRLIRKWKLLLNAASTGIKWNGSLSISKQRAGIGENKTEDIRMHAAAAM